MSAVCDKFKVVCQALKIGTVELKDVVKIGERKLFRGKISDDDKRKELLMVASKLKSMSGFENVYVQKDLTYRQRQELSERRRRGNMTEADSGLLRRVKEDRAHRLPSVIADQAPVEAAGAGTSGVNKHRSGGRGRGSGRGRGVGRGHVHAPSRVVREVYANTPHVRAGSLN